MTSTRAQRAAFGVAAVLLGIALAALRGYPWLTGDQGVFLSVAARMLDGDTLYVDVIDNKDPLFFATYALALLTGGHRGPFALDAIWFALSAVSMALLVRELRAPSSAVVASALVYPLALAASWYRPGLSMLAALALSPLAAWLWLRGRLALSGAVVAGVMLFKLNLALLVIAPIAMLLGLRAPSDVRRHVQVAHAAAGFAATTLAALVVLAVQGALGSYVGVVRNNVHYAGTKSAGALGGVSGHLDVVRDAFTAAGPWQAPAAIAFVVALVLAVGATWRRSGLPGAHLGLTSLAALAGALVTLALTAIWSHHLQMLAYPVALGVAAIVAYAGSLARWSGVVVAVLCAAFALWSTAKVETDGLSTRAWTEAPDKVPSDALERARLRSFADDRTVTYMVFGTNSENAHAVFIDDAFDLSCRWFHLYAFSPPELFRETLDCAQTSAPELILVTLGFDTTGAADPDWRSFVAGSRAFLESEYELIEEAEPGFEVWKRKAEA
jgi:hypothetical protein